MVSFVEVELEYPTYKSLVVNATDSATLLLKDVTSDLLWALLTESSARERKTYTQTKFANKGQQSLYAPLQLWVASTKHKLFCWPCLLFNPSKGTWKDRHTDFIYKWKGSASLFEYCNMHIAKEVCMVWL